MQNMQGGGSKNRNEMPFQTYTADNSGKFTALMTSLTFMLPSCCLHSNLAETDDTYMQSVLA